MKIYSRCCSSTVFTELLFCYQVRQLFAPCHVTFYSVRIDLPLVENLWSKEERVFRAEGVLPHLWLCFAPLVSPHHPLINSGADEIVVCRMLRDSLECLHNLLWIKYIKKRIQTQMAHPCRGKHEGITVPFYVPCVKRAVCHIQYTSMGTVAVSEEMATSGNFVLMHMMSTPS